MTNNEDIDSNAGPKNIISSNIIYGNTNLPVAQCASISCSNDTGGNGIVLDDSRHLLTTNSGHPYGGQTVIEDNIIYNNGGRAITLSMSDHALITNNTVFHNNQDPYEKDAHPGEIEVVSTGDAQIYNNIIYSDGGAGNSYSGSHYNISVSNASDGLGPITAINNILYSLSNNSSQALYSDAASTKAKTALFENNPFVNPLLANPTAADFHITYHSPARGTAYAAMMAPVDIDNVTRSATTPDIGAYQETVPPQCGTSNGQQLTAAPSTNLCAVGTASAVATNSSAWSWTCADPVSWEQVTVTGNTGTWTWVAQPKAETTSCSASLSMSTTAVAPLAQYPGIREPWDQPFSSTSVWNLPIGSGAQWSNASDADTQELTSLKNVYINAAQWSQPFYTGTSSDPVSQVTNYDGSHISPVTPQNIHMPITATPAAAGDRHMNFFDITQPTKIWSYYGCGLNNGTDVTGGVTCALGSLMNTCGDGVITIQGISSYNFGIGTIRHADLVAGAIHHALRFSAAQSLLKSPSTTSWTQGIAWPDVAEDSFGPTNYTGQLLFGSTIGIPASYDLTKLNLSAGGLILAKALQQYGAIVRDSGGTNQIAFYAEPQDATNPLYLQMQQDAVKLAPLLRVMRNQSPTSINGGGTPLQPLAPPLDPAVCPTTTK